MFKHIVEMNGKFYARRWTLFGFECWDRDGYWWHGQSSWWTAYDTPKRPLRR